MAGQIIKLPGVIAASTIGVPRIIQTSADIVAARLPQLAHVFSASAMTPLASGVSGRCRKTGKPFVPMGTVSSLQLRTVAGKVGLGSMAGSSGVMTNGLAFPAGSSTASFSVVCALQINPTDINGVTANVNFLTSFSSDNVLKSRGLTYYGNAHATFGDKMVFFGSDGVSTDAPNTLRPAGDWIIVAVDFNNVTKVASMSVNGAAFVSTTKATNHAPGAGGYFEIGYHVSSSGLRNSLVGDAYVLNDSMRQSAPLQAQLDSLIAALKSDYGIV